MSVAKSFAGIPEHASGETKKDKYEREHINPVELDPTRGGTHELFPPTEHHEKKDLHMDRKHKKK
jgi:hypothetical protein